MPQCHQITVPDHVLSTADIKKLRLPAEGVWFWTQQPMLDTLNSHALRSESPTGLNYSQWQETSRKPKAM